MHFHIVVILRAGRLQREMTKLRLLVLVMAGVELKDLMPEQQRYNKHFAQMRSGIGRQEITAKDQKYLKLMLLIQQCR